MSRTLRTFITRALAALVLAGTLGGAFAAPADAATLDAFESDLQRVVNEFRASRSLPTLAVSDTLTFSAKWMAQDMAVHNYFSHTSLDGRSPMQRMADAGYPAATTWTGENLAAGHTSARAVLDGWLASLGTTPCSSTRTTARSASAARRVRPPPTGRTGPRTSAASSTRRRPRPPSTSATTQRSTA